MGGWRIVQLCHLCSYLLREEALSGERSIIIIVIDDKIVVAVVITVYDRKNDQHTSELKKPLNTHRRKLTE